MLSRNKFLLEKLKDDSPLMKKLNQRKIRRVIKEMKKGERSVYQIAKLQEITPRYVRKLYRSYKETGAYPYSQKPGRKPKPISSEERQIILELKRNIHCVR